MALRLGDVAPDFSAESTGGIINFHEWIGDGWCILLFHSGNFTPVCATELGYISKIKSEFDKRNVKIIAISADSLVALRTWVSDINETQNTIVNCPIISDFDCKVSRSYDMAHLNALEQIAERSVFVIGADKKVKLTLAYPPAIGRNFEEILRVVDALQLTTQFEVLTPVNWTEGEDCIIAPAIPDEDIPARFPKGHTRIRHGQRTTPQPNK